MEHISKHKAIYIFLSQAMLQVGGSLHSYVLKFSHGLLYFILLHFPIQKKWDAEKPS